MTEVSKVSGAGGSVPPMIAKPAEKGAEVKKLIWQDMDKNTYKGPLDPMFEPDKEVVTPAPKTAETDKATAAKTVPDKNLVKNTPHKVNKGFYPAAADTNPAITGKKGILAENGKKIKESSDPAGTVADAVISTKSYTANDAQMKNQIRAMIIAANPSVFEKDGSLKKDKNGKVIADLGKLDLPTASHLLKTVSKEDPKRTVIPKGFYPAFGDQNATINGLTESELRRNQGKEGNNTCGAVQVMNALLKTKGAKFMNSGERKAALLNDLVRRNPSVFDATGRIKPDADLTKLDVPSLEHMVKSYNQLPYKSSKPVVFGNNGFYAVGTGKAAKYYNARGQEVEPAVFATKCPSLYKQLNKPQ